MHFNGTSGNDVLRGTSASDIFELDQGGTDKAIGSGGDDLFRFGDAFTAADRVLGGSGNDIVKLDGNYSAGLSLAAATLASVEEIQFASGHNYHLVTNDGNVAAHATLTLDASNLGAGHRLYFEGQAETDGHFDFIGGRGNDELAGGAQSDTFDLTQGGQDNVHGGAGDDTFMFKGTLDSKDHVAGGDGNDTIYLSGDYTSAPAEFFGRITGVENFILGAGHSYHFSLKDPGVIGTFEIDASALGSGQNTQLRVGENYDNNLYFIGGAGNDYVGSGRGADIFDLTLGGHDNIDGGFGYAQHGSDKFYFGATFGAGDSVTTNSGVVYLDGDYSAGLTITHDQLTNVALALSGGSFTITDHNGNGTLHNIDASALSAAESFNFDGSSNTQNGYSITGGAGNDVIEGSLSKHNFVDLSQGGEDTFTGSNEDSVTFGSTLDAGDHVAFGSTPGGDGTITLSGDYSAGLTLNAALIYGMGNLYLGAGNYDLTLTDDATTNGFLSVTGNVGDGNNLTLDLSQATSYALHFTGHSGNYTITGTALNDTFDLGADFGTNVHIDGGGDDNHTPQNEILIDGDFSDSVHTITAGMIENIQTLKMEGQFGYKFKLADGAGTGGFSALADANSTHSVHFDASGAAGAIGLTGGAGNDTLIGGSHGTDLTGGVGSDNLVSSGGQSFFNYTAANHDSVSTTMDTITGFNAATDDINVTDLNGMVFDSVITGGHLDAATFATDMSAAMAGLAVKHVAAFEPDSGSYAGDVILVINSDGHAGYTDGADLVIQLAGTDPSGLTSANFS